MIERRGSLLDRSERIYRLQQVVENLTQYENHPDRRIRRNAKNTIARLRQSIAHMEAK